MDDTINASVMTAVSNDLNLLNRLCSCTNSPSLIDTQSSRNVTHCCVHAAELVSAIQTQLDEMTDSCKRLADELSLEKTKCIGYDILNRGLIEENQILKRKLESKRMEMVNLKQQNITVLTPSSASQNASVENIADSCSIKNTLTSPHVQTCKPGDKSGAVLDTTNDNIELGEMQSVITDITDLKQSLSNTMAFCRQVLKSGGKLNCDSINRATVTNSVERERDYIQLQSRLKEVLELNVQWQEYNAEREKVELQLKTQLNQALNNCHCKKSSAADGVSTSSQLM